MTRKNLKKDWVKGDVLVKNNHKIIIHEVEENNFRYLSKWVVLHSKDVFPNDARLKNGWKKIDSIKNYSVNNVKKSTHYDNVKGIV